MITSIVCLAAAIFFEARDQPIQGQMAVADVVMNRVESSRWPDEICAVVFQPSQFSFTHDGKSDNYRKYTSNVGDRQAIGIAEEIAKSVIKGARLGLTSTHYHATYVSPYWANHYHLDGRIGDHVFYTDPAGR
jgi:spore germination cell wall hydrolase CwlJ-like protein